MTTPESPLLTIAEACRYLRCCKRTLMAAIAAGRVQSTIATGRRRFRREWLDEFIEAGMRGGGAQRRKAGRRPTIPDLIGSRD